MQKTETGLKMAPRRVSNEELEDLKFRALSLRSSVMIPSSVEGIYVQGRTGKVIKTNGAAGTTVQQ